MTNGGDGIATAAFARGAHPQVFYTILLAGCTVGRGKKQGLSVICKRY